MTPPTGISINNRSGEVTVSSKLDYDQDGFVPTILMYIYATDNPDCENNEENYFMKLVITTSIVFVIITIYHHCSFVSFLLTVTNVNDNCPQFVDIDDGSNNSFAVSVSEVLLM